ncbi:hypothetical protein ScPMuIL_010893 [Solemya velum]
MYRVINTEGVCIILTSGESATGSRGKRQVPSVNSATYDVTEDCINDVEMYIESLLDRQQWALRMFDAYGKLPPNLLGGNINWFGSYDECLNVNVSTLNVTRFRLPFRGKYCRVGIEMPRGLLASLVLGVCLPSSCTDLDTKKLINAGLSYIPTNSTPTVKSVNCHNEKELDNLAIAAITFLVVLSAVIIMGTVYDSVGSIRKKKEDGGGKENESGILAKCLVSFSLKLNVSKFVSTTKSSGSLTAVHGVRFLSMGWVLLGHSFGSNLTTTGNFMDKTGEKIRSLDFMVLTNAYPSVDSFFALSGLLVAYLSLKEMKKRKGSLNWFMYYFHRFWRLTPPYMLFMFVFVALMAYTGNGPNWDGNQPGLNYCKSNWWKNLLYINNFFKRSESNCMAQTWYLANDMQFYIVSPLLFVPLYFSPILGGLACAAFLLATLLASALISAKYSMESNGIAGMVYGWHTEEYSAQYYERPYCRIGPYVIGVITGYILYRTECKIKLKKMYVILGWCIASICILSVFFGLYEYMHGNRISIEVDALYNSTHRIVWAIGLCWIIFASATGYGGFVNEFLSWQGWIPLSRLAYTTFLVHGVVISVHSKQQRVVNFYSDLELVTIFRESARRICPRGKSKKAEGSLCKTRWVERHACLESMLNMYEYIVTCLDAMSNPDAYRDVIGENWDWDRYSITTANGLKLSMRTFVNIVPLVVLCHSLEPVKSLAHKLQYRDSDIYYTYTRIDRVIEKVAEMRKNVDQIWEEWYTDIRKIANEVDTDESCPRITKMQRNRSNVPADTPGDNYKRTVAIPFLDKFMTQMQERFDRENVNIKALMQLVPEVFVSVNLENTETFAELIQQLMFWIKIYLPNMH